MLTSKQLEQITQRAGVHSNLGQPVPSDPEQRLYYGLLEILDFECCKYGDEPEGVTEEDIKQFLLEHKQYINAEALPSFMGLVAGTFNFLGDVK